MIFSEYVENIPLVSIFFARFHETKGSIIEHIYPEGSFPQALQSFSKKLLIPKDELMGKVLTMRTSLTDEKTGQKTQYKIVNCPVMVESQKFNRFQFKFNFGFILKRDYDENVEDEPSSKYFRSSPFAPLVKKLAEDMRKIENEEEWLSNAANHAQTDSIPTLLEAMFTGLSKNGFVNIPVGERQSNEIYLRVFPPNALPNEVRVHHVPVLLDEKIQRLEYADLTVQEMIGRIDGINHIKKICGEHHRDMTPQIACLTIRDLCFAGVCRLDRIFKYSNRYRTTEKLDDLYQHMLLQNPESDLAVYELLKASEFQWLPHSLEPRLRRESIKKTKVTPHDLFRFLCDLSDRRKSRKRLVSSMQRESSASPLGGIKLFGMDHSQSSLESTGSDFTDISYDYSDEDEDEHPMLSDVLEYHTNIAQNCDVRGLIQHAMLKNYIYLVEEYPALRKGERFSEGSDCSNSADQRVELLTSAFSIDEICAHLNLSPTLLKQEFSKTFNDHITYFFK